MGGVLDDAEPIASTADASIGEGAAGALHDVCLGDQGQLGESLLSSEYSSCSVLFSCGSSCDNMRYTSDIFKSIRK